MSESLADLERGEIRGRPTTAQDALNIHPRKLDAYGQKNGSPATAYITASSSSQSAKCLSAHQATRT